MQWIAPSEKDTGPETLENRLWAAADELLAEVIADLPGPVQALRKTPPPARRGLSVLHNRIANAALSSHIRVEIQHKDPFLSGPGV